MPQEESFAVDVAGDVAVDDFHAYLVAQIVEEPDVMVADEPDDFDAHVRHTSQLSEKAYVSARDDSAIFEPIVQDVAHHIERFAVLFERL